MSPGSSDAQSNADGEVLWSRRVVLGVAGGIAAYKAVELCRRLVDAGAHVIPVLTADATRFVGEVTFSALASERARISLWEDEDPIPHTHLGQTADVIVIAPATARLIACYANGIADDLLTSTLLATRRPVVVCPAMHTEMWEHPAVQENVAVLRSRGVHVVEPATGRLAGRDVGPGRLAEPEVILETTRSVVTGEVPGTATTSRLSGLRVLVSAGGTREPIDPVRFIGNRSSGKQGHAIASEACIRGAHVTLVTTTNREVAPGVEVVRVESAAEMEAEMLRLGAEADVIVMSAAVADFRPKASAKRKIRKSEGVPDLVLEPTTDILALLGARKRPGQVLVGFAAETDDLEARASDKMRRKSADLIVANDVSAPGVGFGRDTNAVLVLGADGSRREMGIADKRVVAASVLDAIACHLERNEGQGRP